MQRSFGKLATRTGRVASDHVEETDLSLNAWATVPTAVDITPGAANF